MSQKVPKPSLRAGTIGYDKECRDALTPAVDNLLDMFEQAGWDRKRCATELMFVAANAIKNPEAQPA